MTLSKNSEHQTFRECLTNAEPKNRIGRFLSGHFVNGIEQFLLYSSGSF